MKKMIVLLLICAAVFFAYKQYHKTAVEKETPKSNAVSPELQTAFDTFKKTVIAQRNYFEKSGVYATAFKQLNIEIPGGAVKKCVSIEKPNDNQHQCIITDKYEFFLVGIKNTGYGVSLTPLDNSFSISSFGFPKFKNISIGCAAPTTAENRNICEGLGGKRNPSMDTGNFKYYEIILE